MYTHKGRRIPIGGALSACKGIIEGFIVAAIVAVMFVIQLACPGDLEAQSIPKKLAIAQTADRHWRTSVFAALLETDNASAPVHLDFATCLLAGAQADLLPGDSFRVDDIGDFQCATTPKPFYLIEAPAAPAQVSTLLQFDDGQTHESFNVPPIGSIMPGGFLRVSPVSNDGTVFVTTINVFPVKTTRLFIDVFDAHNHKLTKEPEICDTEPPVTQCTVQTKFSVGSLELSTTVFNGEYGPLPGFVATSKRDGGNARVLPF